MWEIALTDALLAEAQRVAEARFHTLNLRDNAAIDPWEAEYRGAIGHVAYSRFSGLPLHVNCPTVEAHDAWKRRGSPNFPGRKAQSTYKSLRGLIQDRSDVVTDADGNEVLIPDLPLILTFIDRRVNTVYFVGWAMRSEVFDYWNGYGNNWHMPRHLLHPMAELPNE